jgi:TatA/E family protein of Tat protein translocase
VGRGLELFLLILVGTLLFGAKRLPGAAKALGESINVFKKSVNKDEPDPNRPPTVIPGTVEPDPSKDQGRDPGA